MRAIRRPWPVTPTKRVSPSSAAAWRIDPSAAAPKITRLLSCPVRPKAARSITFASLGAGCHGWPGARHCLADGSTEQLPLTESPGQLVAPHLRPARQVASLGLAVQLLARLGLRRTGPLAPRHGSALLAERGTGLLRHLGDGLLLLGRLDRLADVPLGGLPLLRRRHPASSLLRDSAR